MQPVEYSRVVYDVNDGSIRPVLYMKHPEIKKTIFRLSIIASIVFLVSGYIGYRIYKEALSSYKTEKHQFKAYMKYLKEIDDENLEEDKELYGEKLELLYMLASNNNESTAYSKVMENAFKKMISDYPKSYVTAKVIAEHAIMSIRKEDIPAAENYYNMLNKSDFVRIVTDKGLDAVPNIEHDLAWLYFRKGQLAKLKELTRNLEENHSDSYVLTSGIIGFSIRRLRPVSEAIIKLKSAISGMERSTL